VYLASAGLIVFFTISTTLSKAVNLQNAAFGALVAAFPNTGFMGVPLLVALLGPSAAGPVICAVLADLFVTSSVCIAVAQAHSAVEHGARVAALRALRSTVSNPLPWSIALGGLFSVAGLKLPAEVQSVVNMLADAATPVALFTIGAVLWRAGQHVSRRTPVRDYAPVALVKLFVHPLLVFALAAAVHRLGAPLSSFQVMVLTLAAALPSASNVSLLAERYGADNGRVARIIMTSTVLAFVSFPLLAWLFGVRPG
jgi:malonate transporter